ncbi:MAG: hypothetical protein ABR523_11005 [Desulfurivibrionaceae bacterium]
MSALRLITIGMVLLLTSGCGQLVSEKLAMSGSSSPEKCTSKKMVILPFADYTYAEDAERAFQRHIKIMEGLTANLVGRGFRLPIQEDLLKYLADHKIVTMGKDTDMGIDMPGYIQDAIANDTGWSADMKAEMAKIAEKDGGGAGDNRLNNYALDSKTLAEVAGQFNADLVMRGQLLEYEFGEENTWSPLKRGVFPVVFGGTNRALFGVTNSETYDTLGSTLIGAGAGAFIGDGASSPYDATEKINPGRHNSMIWGLGGAALGYMSSKGGHTNRVAVQLRLWVQDPDSGEVVWTNSAKVMVTPQSVFAENRKDELFDTAVTQAVAALTEDFVKSAKTAL